MPTTDDAFTPNSNSNAASANAGNTNLSKKTLEQTPDRVAAFLRGVGVHPDIRSILFDHGYDEQIHLTGWTLLARSQMGSFDGLAQKDGVAAAFQAVEAWNQIGYHRIHAALAGNHPDAAAYVFADLAPAKGIQAILNAEQVLDRLEALRTGSDAARSATAADDRAAIDLLAARGIGAPELAALAANVEAAKGAKAVPPMAPAVLAHDQALASLRSWFDEWSEVARAVLPRRDQLIRVGLAHRQPRKGAAPAATAPAGSTPAPLASTPPATAAGSGTVTAGPMLCAAPPAPGTPVAASAEHA